MRSGLVGIIAVALCAGRVAAAPRTASELAIEQQIRADVARVSPAAAAAFDEGTVARDAHHLDAALASFRRAIELAPGVDHVHRRACNVLDGLKRRAEALAECELALKLGPASPYNKVALAGVLSVQKDHADDARALALALEAADALPTDLEAHALACSLEVQTGKVAEASVCIEHLFEIDPKALSTNFLGALNAAASGGFYYARQRLETARAAGLDDKTYRAMRAMIDQAERDRDKEPTDGLSGTLLLEISLWIVVPWFGLLIVLLVAGRMVSRAIARGATAFALSRRVLAACGLYLYASIPIVLVAGALAGTGAVLALFTTNRIPTVIGVIIAVVLIAAITSRLRRLAFRPEPALPGQHVDPASQPRLWALLDDVAETVGANDIDAVYLTTGVEVCVVERTGLWSALRRGETESILMIGVAALDDMTQLELRSLLAHELDRSRDADSAGGGYAIVVRLSAVELCNGLARAGVVALDPTWWLLRAYHRIFAGIARGAAQVQERLADRWAVEAYGSAAFASAQRHLVTRGVRFPLELGATVDAAIATGRPVANLYRDVVAVGGANVDIAVAERMHVATGELGAYATPSQRIDAAEALAIARAPRPGDDAPAWELFDDREAVERAATELLRDRLERTGCKLPAPPEVTVN